MKFLKKFVEIIFPNHCISCEEIIDREGTFCAECWPKLQFITEPKCAVCSYPFEFQGLNLLCGKCLTKRPSFDKAITIFRYNHILRRIISSLKYRDQTFLAKKFAKLLWNYSKKEISDCDILSAVPLHPKRLRKRKFNQAALLAKNIMALSQIRFCKKFLGGLFFGDAVDKDIHEEQKNKATTKFAAKIKFTSNKTLALDLLIRSKNTQPQVELKKKDREHNLKNVFELNEKYRSLVRGKKIILIDDVYTTGATLENCAKVLKKAGAKKVVVLTIAKTALI